MKIIYHTPVPLNPDASVGCGIRPIKMLEAFKQLGCDVTIVAGTARERRNSINSAITQLEKGINFDFCYSESPPLPTLLSEKHRLPLNPFLDFGFFAALKLRKVPIGLFYRDIYWAVREYPSGWGPIKEKIANYFYKYDIKKYAKLIDIFYLPSLRMGNYIPQIDKGKMDELPPGCDLNFEAPDIHRKKDAIKIFYVGGIGAHYQMHELFAAVAESIAELCICTREPEWIAVAHEYKHLISHNSRVVHKSGKDLDTLYTYCNIASLFLKPSEYRTFAAPLKLYEYLGRGKPVIATKGTLAGDFVQRHDIGWVIPYDKNELRNLIAHLSENPAEIEKARKNAIATANMNTWKERARKVAEDLMVSSKNTKFGIRI